MKRVGVSIVALAVGNCLLFPPKLLLFPKFPPFWNPPLLFCFPRDYSTVIDLPNCSVPLSSRALLNEALLLNLTKAKPLDLPSSLVKSLTLITLPKGLNKSSMSLWKAWNESPFTQI